MNPDPLEAHLEKLQPRSLPASWRREIIAAVESKNPPPAFLSWLPGRWMMVTFATAWVVIVLLRLNTPPLETSPDPTIRAGDFAKAQQEELLLIVSLENLPFEDPDLSSSSWPFLLERRPL